MSCFKSVHKIQLLFLCLIRGNTHHLFLFTFYVLYRLVFAESCDVGIINPLVTNEETDPWGF